MRGDRASHFWGDFAGCSGAPPGCGGPGHRDLQVALARNAESESVVETVDESVDESVDDDSAEVSRSQGRSNSSTTFAFARTIDSAHGETGKKLPVRKT